MYTPKQVAETLKQTILESHDSMQKFAEVLRISPSNLSNILSGKSFLSANNALKFANALMMNPRFLAYGEEPKDFFGTSEFDVPGYPVRLRPAIFSALNPSPDETEFIGLILGNNHFSTDYKQVHIEFDGDAPRFERMTAAAKSLATRLIERSVVESCFYAQEHIEATDDEKSRIYVYHEYHPFFKSLMIKTNLDHTGGYIELYVDSSYFEISDMDHITEPLSAMMQG